MKILMLIIIVTTITSCSSSKIDSGNLTSNTQLEKEQRDQMVRNLRLIHDKN